MRPRARRLPPILLLAVLAAAWAAAWAAPAAAEPWASIEPGVSAIAQVRTRFGNASREVRKKVEGYDTTEWIYEGQQAPVGFFRMSVEFGLLDKAGAFKSDVVRTLRLDPKPFIFTQPTVLDGWGRPDAVGTENDRVAFFYRSGLIVVFDETKVHAATMLFTLPQVGPNGPAPAAGAAPAAPKAGAAPAPAAPAPGGAATPRK